MLQGCFGCSRPSPGFAQHDGSMIGTRHPERNAMEPKGLSIVEGFCITEMLRLRSAALSMTATPY